MQYGCRCLTTHCTDLYGIWPRAANRSQIRRAEYRREQSRTSHHSTIPASPPNRVPCSTGVAASPRTVLTCTEYGHAWRTVVKSDRDSMDAYRAVLLVTVRYRHPCLTSYCAVPVSRPRSAPYRPVQNLAARSKPKPNQTGRVQRHTGQDHSLQYNTGIPV